MTPNVGTEIRCHKTTQTQPNPVISMLCSQHHLWVHRSKILYLKLSVCCLLFKFCAYLLNPFITDYAIEFITA